MKFQQENVTVPNSECCFHRKPLHWSNTEFCSHWETRWSKFHRISLLWTLDVLGRCTCWNWQYCCIEAEAVQNIIDCMFKYLPQITLRKRVLYAWDLWYGDFGSCRILKIKSSHFLLLTVHCQMMTQLCRYSVPCITFICKGSDCKSAKS
jgi:hypothetical protein